MSPYPRRYGPFEAPEQNLPSPTNLPWSTTVQNAPIPRMPYDQIGFTAPTIIYDKMRAIETLAKDLGPKILTYVADPAFVRAWTAFDAEWTPFFQKYQGESDIPRLGALFYTDDLNKQTEAFQTRINALRADYENQRQANGQPVPQPVAPPIPVPAPNAPSRTGATGLPWYFWTLFGIGLVGAGYLAYRYYQRAQMLKAGIREELLPAILPGGFGHAVARASRDPEAYESAYPAYPPAPTFPRTLEDFAHDPRAYALARRPSGGHEDVRRMMRALEQRGYRVEPAGSYDD